MNRFLRVSEMMSTQLVTVPPFAPIGDAARLMRERGIGSVLVCDGASVLGIVTERDIVGAVAQNRDTAKSPVTEIMTRDPVMVPPDTDIVFAARTMADRGIRHLPVAEEDRALGMVSIRDLVRWGLAALAIDSIGEEAQAAFEALGSAKHSA